MSILYAVVLTLCHVPSIAEPKAEQCDSYVIQVDDSWNTRKKCINNGLRPEANKFARLWQDDTSLTDYLSQYDIVQYDGTTPQDINLLTDYDFTCERH